MSFRGVKLWIRCTVKHAGKWQVKRGRAECAECERNIECLAERCGCGAEDERRRLLMGVTRMSIRSWIVHSWFLLFRDSTRNDRW